VELFEQIRREYKHGAGSIKGVASVLTSKSFGWMPRSRSRTRPPTRYVVWPCACSPGMISKARASRSLLPTVFRRARLG
jgi:hypothetical protein